jgi:hypothetical protein
MQIQGWEYLVLTYCWDEPSKKYYWDTNLADNETISEKLNRYGQVGWKLVDTRAFSSTVTYYHFKRPILVEYDSV